MKWSTFHIVCVALLVLITSCDNGVSTTRTSGPVSTSSAKPELPMDKARAAFKPGIVQVTAEPQRASDRVVFLLGENHASVQTQVQIAELAGNLLDAGLVDAILIEGSSGNIDFGATAAALTRDGSGRGTLTDDAVHAYWRAELEWGHIAAYEFIGLTRPGIAVNGVEDMEAKARFAIKALAHNARDLERARESDTRSVLLFENAVAKVNEKADPDSHNRIEANLKSYKNAIARCDSAHAIFVKACTPSDERVKLEVARAALTQQWREFYPVLQAVQRDQDEYEEAFAAYQAKLKPYRSQIASLKHLVARANAGDAVAQSQLDDLASVLSDLETRLDDIKRLEGRLKSFETDHGPRLKELKAEAKRVSDRVTVLEARRARAMAPFAKVLKDKDDAFFTLANTLRDVGSSLGLQFGKIESFFRDEADRVRAAKSRDHIDMSERDAAMVKNTQSFFDQGDVRRVILIVGAAHLGEMTARLREVGFDVLAGKMVAADADLAPWEEEEFRKREEGYSGFFEDLNMNPEAHFSNPHWVQEQILSMQTLRELGTWESRFVSGDERLAGDGRIYRSKNGSKAIVVSSQRINPEARVGEYLVRRGPMPEEPAQHYELYDRTIAARLARDLSDPTSAFVYYHKIERKGRGSYVLHAARGELTIEQFEASPPGGRPRRVVMFGEPDGVMRGKVEVSPLWERLRGVGGGEGGPPSKGPRWTRAWDDAPKQPGGDSSRAGGANRARLFMTLNPVRAKRNISLMEKQQAKGSIHFVDFEADPKGLEQAHFSSPDGDYARMVVIVAKNTSEFRSAVKMAAESRKLEGKQVALVTCGDAFGETGKLKELMLDSGAVMVWVPDRQITEAAGRALFSKLKRQAQEKVRGDISDVVFDTLEVWHKENPNDPDLPAFRLSVPWVILWPQNESLHPRLASFRHPSLREHIGVPS